MSIKIKINKIISELDYGKIDEKYEVFAVKTDKKYFSKGSRTLDSPLTDKRIVSLCFESGRVFYVMMEHNSENKSVLRKICDETEDADKLSLNKVSAQDVDNHIMLQLMINGISAKSHPMLKFNNLTGRFFCFNPEWIIRDKTDIKQIKTIEFHINKTNTLEMNLRTFTSLKHKDSLKFGRKNGLNILSM